MDRIPPVDAPGSTPPPAPESQSSFQSLFQLLISPFASSTPSPPLGKRQATDLTPRSDQHKRIRVQTPPPLPVRPDLTSSPTTQPTTNMVLGSSEEEEEEEEVEEDDPDVLQQLADQHRLTVETLKDQPIETRRSAMRKLVERVHAFANQLTPAGQQLEDTGELKSKHRWQYRIGEHFPSQADLQAVIDDPAEPMINWNEVAKSLRSSRTTTAVLRKARSSQGGRFVSQTFTPRENMSVTLDSYVAEAGSNPPSPLKPHIVPGRGTRSPDRLVSSMAYTQAATEGDLILKRDKERGEGYTSAVYMTGDGSFIQPTYYGKGASIKNRGRSKTEGAMGKAGAIGHLAGEAFRNMPLITDCLTLVEDGLDAGTFEMGWVTISREVFGLADCNQTFKRPTGKWFADHGWPLLDNRKREDD